MKYATTDRDLMAASAEIALTPPPPLAKCLCSEESFSLPAPRRNLNADVGAAMLDRRTCRSFLDRHVEMQEMADVLFYAGGAVFSHPTNFFGPVLKKCAPSPGARHATEIYPVIRAVHGVPQGIYHYCGLHHRITSVSEEDVPAFLIRGLQKQKCFADAAVTCFLTAVTGRVRWKYRQSRAFRLMHYEIGHYAQNLLLASTALGLGAFVTGALVDSYVEDVLGADGVDEVLMYAAGFGPRSEEGPYRREGVEISGILESAEGIRLPAPMPDLPQIPGDVESFLNVSGPDGSQFDKRRGTYNDG
ncbi:SagB/ThcOx family dehydrogenase [Streptomyces sp. NPDC004237]|uniref:SagB/ThcOx family dehydrogenase n=1 Tax=Streptomyces sp. NPDC004237 TaxID=3154455 RepID=UPI0033BE0DB3